MAHRAIYKLLRMFVYVYVCHHFGPSWLLAIRRLKLGNPCNTFTFTVACVVKSEKNLVWWSGKEFRGSWFRFRIFLWRRVFRFEDGENLPYLIFYFFSLSNIIVTTWQGETKNQYSADFSLQRSVFRISVKTFIFRSMLWKSAIFCIITDIFTEAAAQKITELIRGLLKK